MMTFLLLITVCFVAYANGANDNFKGVATLFGSGTAQYRTALYWASAATLLGALTSAAFSQAMIRRFSGQDLLPADIAGSPQFVVAVALGAALTVMLATITGFPISTTHSLTGALVGAGVAAVGIMPLSILVTSFLTPLLIAPVLAFALCYVSYPFTRQAAARPGKSERVCICIESQGQVEVVGSDAAKLCLVHSQPRQITYGTSLECGERDTRTLVQLTADKTLDLAHYLSAGAVSFARGLNDTPKIAALLISSEWVHTGSSFLIVGLAMLLGGLLNARKVANTMSHKITPMSSHEGLTANVVTGALVLFASRFALPVSTTHTSVGSLFGVGAIRRTMNNRVAGEIVLSWVLTLPVAYVFAASLYWIMR